jgi:uncharacterized protein with von Willebrand factor type A (vWA) domain
MVMRRWRRERSGRDPGGHRFAYSRWDGSQRGFELTAEELLAEMNDDLLYHGDLNAALRRLLQSGFEHDGERVQGLRDILEQLRRRRQERLEQHDLGGVYDEIARELSEVVATERESLDELAADARQSGDERRQQITDEVVNERNLQLDLLPNDLAGKVQSLQNYEFTSTAAREHFEELLDRLRQQLIQQQLDAFQEGMDNLTDADRQRIKDMLAALNHMLEQRARGEEPDFEGFMDRFGDFFPENPQNLDELLEALAQRMAAAQAMLNSMTPEQRAQLQALSDQLLEDMDLRWQMDQLAQNLQQAFPEAGWERRYGFSGDQPLSLGEAAEVFDDLADLDRLENLLRQATNPGALAEVDLDRARELLGDDARRSLEQMAEFARMLEEAGLIENREGRYELTPRAIRRIGQTALSDLFARLSKDRLGRHALEQAGVGHEREYSTKPYEYGDPFNLHIERTVRNAVTRRGAGTPVRLLPEDFEVERTETLVRSSTVLMLDLSLSMPMRENFLPAKKVAMALHALISMQYPRDFLGIVGFSEVARTIEAHELPEVSWDFVYGTNMQHAFILSRQMLARQSGTKQIIMITDGEPTAHIDPSGRPHFHYPPTRETVDKTLAEVAACTREGIRINTFMLDASSYLTQFIEKLTELNGGRAFFTSPETLGDYVLVDFVEHKRKLLGGRRSA